MAPNTAPFPEFHKGGRIECARLLKVEPLVEVNASAIRPTFALEDVPDRQVGAPDRFFDIRIEA